MEAKQWLRHLDPCYNARQVMGQLSTYKSSKRQYEEALAKVNVQSDLLKVYRTAIAQGNRAEARYNIELKRIRQTRRQDSMRDGFDIRDKAIEEIKTDRDDFRAGLYNIIADEYTKIDPAFNRSSPASSSKILKTLYELKELEDMAHWKKKAKSQLNWMSMYFGAQICAAALLCYDLSMYAYNSIHHIHSGAGGLNSVGISGLFYVVTSAAFAFEAWLSRDHKSRTRAATG
ncbi:MAG: hypothetical protein KGH61_02540 [Candidatus Micrarchaeota archaeon]|nr:hypothetical protein [Candidatus Micrarchaeota archaeon]MDE1847804.1 hypothetical protein [Candidatus Micrarchaeota archaeon]MDE1864242.1 hypothetical protein [Candidatus Micrarchaeota archaeon]